MNEIMEPEKIMKPARKLLCLSMCLLILICTACAGGGEMPWHSPVTITLWHVYGGRPIRR